MRQYIFGKPFEEFSVVEQTQEIIVTDDLINACPITNMTWKINNEDGWITYVIPLDRDDIVYGLGESMHGINKRGGKYVSYNTDNSHHSDKMHSMYGSHNFIIIDRGCDKSAEAYYFDTPARVVWDIDVDESGEIVVVCETLDMRLLKSLKIARTRFCQPTMLRRYSDRQLVRALCRQCGLLDSVRADGATRQSRM